jgi:hypothetical protein
MRLLRLSVPSLFVIAFFISQLSVDGAKPGAPPDRLLDEYARLFDEYGRIGWRDEKARLDNFAIQLIDEPKAIGYIFVINGRNGCSEEAAARAIRAKRYLVEHRSVPWNRVISKEDGYGDTFRTVLLAAPADRPFSYPAFGSKISPDEVHATKNCGTTIARIRHSKW